MAALCAAHLPLGGSPENRKMLVYIRYSLALFVSGCIFGNYQLCHKVRNVVLEQVRLF
jgi:hypothetical protein